MLNPQLLGFGWGMQWVREQEQSIHQSRFCGTEHGRLPSSVRMSAKKHSAGDNLAQGMQRILKPFTVEGGISRSWRAKGFCLAKRQIATQHRKTCARKGLRDGLQQRCSGVGPRSVRQYQAGVW